MRETRHFVPSLLKFKSETKKRTTRTTEWRLNDFDCPFFAGVGGILVMGLGIIISGVFILRAKPNARFVAAWIAFTAVIYAIGMGVLMFIGCPMDDFAGLVSHSDG